jgi:serine/threonine protein kinase
MGLSTGTRLGPYGVGNRLGAGGEGFRARDPRLGRDVAVKALSSVADSDLLTRFQREAQILAALNHPHIAAIYGLNCTAGSS